MSEYMQGGALASDDLDFSASSDRGRASERASTAVKSPALNLSLIHIWPALRLLAVSLF